MKNLKLILGMGALLALGALSGCGNHTSSSGTPVIIIHNGYYGYYTNSIWCDWTNDYCGSGIGYGIGDSGCYYDGSYCNGGYTGNGSGTGGYSSGGYSSGSYSGGTTTNGSGTGYSSGSTSTGSYSSGSYSTGSYSSGSTSTGSYSTGSYSSGTTTNGSGTGYSQAGSTKDTDLQRAALQQQQLTDRAQALASQFSMNVEAARQLTQLSDRMSQLQSAGKLTDDDRDAIARSALGVAGINPDEVNAAVATMIKTGDKSSVNKLVEKGATNLGMPNSAALRSQILPSLGINLN